jgi:geranylgeranyl pyrophosphate synthase
MNKSTLAMRDTAGHSVEADSQLEALKVRVEEALDHRLPPSDSSPGRLHDAMRYATLGGGKRFRALLVYGAGEVVGAGRDALDDPACAVELVHAYSLIHDDLPSMDDDALRRGKPTTHIAFDEATAILAGDALQALAFGVISGESNDVPSDSRSLQQVRILALAGGSTGMAGGQMLDLQGTNNGLAQEALRELHSLKTGALIRASVRLGALCSGSTTDDQLAALDAYATAIGLAFQVIDDVLDEESDTETLGKTSGADRRRGKSTYPALLGIENSRQAARDLYHQAIASLQPLGDNTALLARLAERIVTRTS